MREPPADAFDVAVLGGGPAGATAALHLARDGFSVVVVDPLGIGGALVNVDHLPDHPGFPDGIAGWDLAAALGEQALTAGVSVTMGRADPPEQDGSGWTVPVSGTGSVVRPRAVLVATGCRARRLPGDDDGSLEGAGVSYCASCDGPLHAGRPVAVVGDGAVALAEAVTLAATAESVAVVFGSDRPRAGRAWVEAATAQPHVALLAGHAVTNVAAGDDGQVTLDVRTSAGERRTLTAAAVFGALDPVPNSELLSGLAVPGPDGRIAVGDDLAVRGAPPGLFAAGDVRSGAPQRAVSAAGDGAAAAAGIAAYLGGSPPQTPRRSARLSE